MAYFRCLSNRSNLLTRRRQPSIGYIVHHGDDCKHNLTDEVPSSLGFRSFLQQRGFGSGFARATLLGSMKDERCANFSVRASFCRRMSTANGVESEKDESIDDGDEVVSDTTVETAASVANEVAIAAADSFFPIALVQHGIDAIHTYFGFNWWACIVCATIVMRLSVLPLVVMQMKASSKLMLVGPHLGAIKEKILDGLVAPRSGTIKQKTGWGCGHI